MLSERTSPVMTILTDVAGERLAAGLAGIVGSARRGLHREPPFSLPQPRSVSAVAGLFLALVLTTNGWATQKNLPVVFSNTHGCNLGSSPCEIELTDLAITDVITGPTDDVRFVLFNLNVGQSGTVNNPTQIQLRITKDAVTIGTPQVFTLPVAQTSIQIPVTLTGLSVGSHDYKFLVTQNTSGPVNYTTSTYSLVAALNVANTSPAATVTPQTIPTALSTPTPLAFGTPGVIPIFASTPGTQLQPYAGSACPTPGIVKSMSAAGVVACVTPVPTATAKPNPTPQPTAAAVGASTRLLSTSGVTDMDGTTDRRLPLVGSGNVATASGLQVAQSTGVDGAFTKLYCDVDTAPGGAGKSWAITLTGNVQDLTCTISNAATSCNDTTHSAAETGTDINFIKVSPTSSPAATKIHCSTTFTPS